MLDIIKCIFQPAIGQLWQAVIFDGSAVLIHVVEEQEQTGLHQQFMGGIAVSAMLQHGQNAGSYSLIEGRI